MEREGERESDREQERERERVREKWSMHMFYINKTVAILAYSIAQQRGRRDQPKI
jgi:hypothetical protein